MRQIVWIRDSDRVVLEVLETRESWIVPPSNSLRILLVDDDQLLGRVIAELLNTRRHIARAVTSASDALVEAEKLDPQLVVVDLDLGPGPTGIDLAYEIRRRHPYAALMIMTSFRSPELVGGDREGILENISYFVKADLDAKRLVDAIESAAKGVDVSTGFINKDWPVITKAQSDLLRMLAQGKSIAEIAQVRGTTVRSVHLLTRRLLESLGLDPDSGKQGLIEALRIYRQGNIVVE